MHPYSPQGVLQLPAGSPPPLQLLIWNRLSSLLVQAQLPGHTPPRAASGWRRCGRPGCWATQTGSVRRPQKGDRGQGFLWERARGRRRPPAWLCGAFRPARALLRSLARGRSWRARGRLGGTGGLATCGFGELARRWSRRRSPTSSASPLPLSSPLL